MVQVVFNLLKSLSLGTRQMSSAYLNDVDVGSRLFINTLKNIWNKNGSLSQSVLLGPLCVPFID